MPTSPRVHEAPLFDVVGVGANSIDHVYLLPEYPRPDSPSSKLRITSHRLSPGGQMTTALCTCAALGRRTAYVGTFGSDDNAARMRHELTRRGVDISRSMARDVPNRYAVILIDERAGERVILWERDPALTMQPGELPRQLLTHARVVHIDDEDEEAAIAAAAIGREAGAIVTSDIDRVTPRTPALVDAVTIPIFAEHVPEALTGEPDLAQALRRLRQPHHTMLCVTQGSRGALLLHGDTVDQEPGFAVEVVDTTGAGDVFRGAFIHALLDGAAPRELLRFANAAAAVACTRHGAIGGVPGMEDVSRRQAAGSRQ